MYFVVHRDAHNLSTGKARIPTHSSPASVDESGLTSWRNLSEQISEL